MDEQAFSYQEATDSPFAWFQFDEHDVVEGRSPVPAGTYLMEQVVDPKNGTRIVEGKSKPQVLAAFRIIEGPHSGRMVFTRYFTSEHPYARKLANTWLRAMGVTQEVWDAVQPSHGGRGVPDLLPLLAGRKARVTVSCDVPRDKDKQPLKRDDGTPYDPRNEIVDIVAVPGQEPIQVTTQSYGFRL